MTVSVLSNAVGNGFDVAGKAVSTSGDTWDLAGTMTTDGAFQATGTGTGAVPPANMTLAGSMTAATQISATASFTLNNVAKNVPLTLEKAVAAAAAPGKFALATDPGVTNAAQIQHMAANLAILANGTVSASLIEGEVTGIAVLAPVLGARYVLFSGVITSTGGIIAIGGMPGAGETTISRNATPPSSVALLTGTVTAAGASATIKALDITGGGPDNPHPQLRPRQRIPLSVSMLEPTPIRRRTHREQRPSG